MSSTVHKNRTNSVKLTRHMYIMGPQFESAPAVCAYCGVTGSITEDHVIPVSGMAGLLEVRNLLSWIVPCCHECNVIISSKSPYRIGGVNNPRQQFLRKRDMVRHAIEKRYFKSSRGRTKAVWTEEELSNGALKPGQLEDDEKISYRLTQLVRAGYTREEILQRLAYDCFAYW